MEKTYIRFRIKTISNYYFSIIPISSLWKNHIEPPFPSVPRFHFECFPEVLTPWWRRSSTADPSAAASMPTRCWTTSPAPRRVGVVWGVLLGFCHEEMVGFSTKKWWSGWWFGTSSNYFPITIGNFIIPTDFNFNSIIFQRGRLKPLTRWWFHGMFPRMMGFGYPLKNWVF